MLSRTTTFLASALIAVSFSACSSRYSDVYSFKKNKFVPPPEKKTEVALPTPVLNPLEGASVTPTTDPSLAIPGIPSTPPPAPGIPGLPVEALPGAPAVPPPGTNAPVEAVQPPAGTPAPGTPPPAPGTPAIPGL